MSTCIGRRPSGFSENVKMGLSPSIVEKGALGIKDDKKIATPRLLKGDVRDVRDPFHPSWLS